MDFPTDLNVHAIADEFMFGPSFLVAPLYTPSNGRDVYAPNLGESGGKWRNFYTGVEVPSGWHSMSGIGITESPLLVRSSILVMSPIRQHAFEVVENDAHEIRIYDGTNSSFALYIDDGHDPSSDRSYCDIAFVWNDETTALTVEAAKGNRCDEIFVPMQMDITLVASGHGIGVSPSVPDVIVAYTGIQVVVPLGPTKREIIS